MRLLNAKDANELAELLLGSDPRHPRTARLVGRAERFIGWLDGDAQRTAFLEEALDAAWHTRHNWNLQYNSIEEFWTSCLQIAALTRSRWLVSVATLPGVYEKRWIRGGQLERRDERTH